MKNKTMTGTTLVAGVTAAAVAASAEVDAAFETLKGYDWGADRGVLDPIDRAIIATEGDVAARKELEKRLVDTLAGGISRSAQDYVCRRLRTVGTVQSVDALAALLPNESTSHIARYALERIPDEKALEAMRAALPKVDNKLKPGILGSLGKRRDEKSVGAMAASLGSSDVQIVKAAAEALSMVASSAAAKELSKFAKKAPDNMKIPVADACLTCAEKLMAAGKKGEAMALYTELKGNDQPSHVKAAAVKGMLTSR